MSSPSFARRYFAWTPADWCLDADRFDVPAFDREDFDFDADAFPLFDLDECAECFPRFDLDAWRPRAARTGLFHPTALSARNAAGMRTALPN